MGGSVIFQCWGGRRRLTGLLSDSSSFSLRSAAFISPGSAWDGWQTTKSGHPSQGDSLEAAVVLSECVCVCVSGSVCIRVCCRLFVLNKHIKCGGIILKLQTASSYLQRKACCFWLMPMEDEPPAHSHPPTSWPPSPVGHAHKLDLLLELTHFNMGSLERDAASTGIHLFLCPHAPVNTAGCLWYLIFNDGSKHWISRWCGFYRCTEEVSNEFCKRANLRSRTGLV